MNTKILEMNRIPLPKRPLKCLHLGDSYTIGEGLPLSEAWPHQLWDRMEDAGMDIAETSIIAQTGWTSGDLLEALQLSTLRIDILLTPRSRDSFLQSLTKFAAKERGSDPAKYIVSGQMKHRAAEKNWGKI